MSFRQGLAQLKARGGLGAVLGESLFPLPAEVAGQVDPATVKALRKQALTQLGLGLMAAPRSAGLGGALQYGLGQGQRTLQGGLGQILEVQDRKRADKRLDLAEARQAAVDERMAQQYKRESDWHEEAVKTHGVERAQDLQARAADDARMLESAALQRQLAKDATERQYWTERLSGNVAGLRAAGIGDDDPLMVKLLTHLKGLGVNQYTPPSAVNYGLGLGGGASPPDLSGFAD